MADAAKSIPGINQNYSSGVITSRDQLNRIGRQLNKLTQSPDLINGPAHYSYTGAATATIRPYTLQATKPANNQCKISAGTIRLGTGNNYAVAETTVTLTGATEYVYVRVTLSDGTTSVLHSSTEPETDSTYFYLIIIEFIATAGNYDQGTEHWRGGDFNAFALLIT